MFGRPTHHQGWKGNGIAMAGKGVRGSTAHGAQREEARQDRGTKVSLNLDNASLGPLPEDLKGASSARQ